MIDQSPGRRAAAYWFADGLPDLYLGTILIVFSGTAMLWQALAPHRWIFDFWLMSGGFLLHVTTERKILGFLKSRTTWRRTGYVQPPEELLPRPEFISLSLDAPPPNENVSHFVRRTVQAVFFALFGLFSSTPVPAWFAASIMVLLALLLYFANRNTEHHYGAWWTGVFAASGLIFLVVKVAPPLEALLCYLIAGTWLLVRGTISRVRYLQESAGKGSA